MMNFQITECDSALLSWHADRQMTWKTMPTE